MFKAFIPVILLTVYLTILLWIPGLGKKSFKQPKTVACGNKKKKVKILINYLEIGTKKILIKTTG